MKIEALLAAAITGHAPDEEVSAWLAKRDDVLLDKLAAVTLIPIFPELCPYLEAVFDKAEPGMYVLPAFRTRGAAVNLRTRLERIILRAGLIPWPRLWQNLRSARETELADQFPAHVVCQWIGNSELVAKKHYLQVTDEHYRQAGTESGTATRRGFSHRFAK